MSSPWGPRVIFPTERPGSGRLSLGRKVGRGPTREKISVSSPSINFIFYVYSFLSP